jgi:hypothetical protein
MREVYTNIRPKGPSLEAMARLNFRTFDANRHAILQSRHQDVFSISAWTGIVGMGGGGNWLIGSYVLASKLKGVEYQKLLVRILPDLVEDELERIRPHVDS